ncbi:MAG: hypothetical protein OHK0057_09740 [Thermoflexibacter sp.]
MKYKPLIINTNKGQAEGVPAIWNEMQNVQNFIKDISTPTVNTAQGSVELSAVISGIPTPWARAMMFRYAIEYPSHPPSVPPVGGETGGGGVFSFFKSLQDEWKGLIAVLALDNSPISVEKVELKYDRPDNLFEVKGALGNMLFDSKHLWTDPEEIERNPDTPPYIQIIKYNGIVIGGTSPHSLLFTAPVYQIQPNKSISPFYKNGRFTNPVIYLDNESLQKLFVYVQFIRENIVRFQDKLSIPKKPKHDLTLVKNFLAVFEKEILDQARKNNFELNPEGLVGSLDKFKKPFDIIFNSESKIYGYQGNFYSQKINDNAKEVNLSELLLPTDTHLVEIRFAPHESAEKCAVHLLEAQGDERKRFYALPLSQTGIIHFEETLHLLLGKVKDSNYRNSLSALYEPEKRQVKVMLSLEIDNGKSNLTIESIYGEGKTQDYVINSKKIIAFPDFVSDLWQSYYLYSELPHNTNEVVRAHPILADYDFKFRIIPKNTDVKDSHDSLAVLSKRNSNLTGLESNLLVQYDYDKLGTTNIKYEIYESKFPFKGVELHSQNLAQGGNKICGYLVAKDIRLSDKYGFKKLQFNSLHPAKIGFDFGSNNICVSFTKSYSQPQLVHFKNRRRFFLGNEIEDEQKVKPAEPNELFFFQNEERIGQLKSMVLVHDEKRLAKGEMDIAKAVSGGFPVFEYNVPISEPVTSTKYTVRLGTSQAEIYYNMKWSHVEKENKYKEALLKTLWLKIYAELFAENEAYPAELAWAYPSAMSESTCIQYGLLWESVAMQKPLNEQYAKAKVAAVHAIDHRALTESEAVCKYALSSLGGMSPSQDILVVGYDVGGSTTDILMILKVKDKNGNYINRLIKQSSVLVAASALAESVKKSRKLQSAIQLYAEQNQHIGKIYGIQNINEQTAPYFLNVLFDRLNHEDLDNLYKTFFRTEAKEIFAVSAFITGLLSFYSGQITAKVIEKYPEIKMVQRGFYGKGGKIFDWLPSVVQGLGEQFYNDCFLAGVMSYELGVISDNQQLQTTSNNFKPQTLNLKLLSSLGGKHHKSEVSFGLSTSQEVDMSNAHEIPEIIGEAGYCFNGHKFTHLDKIEAHHLENFDGALGVPSKFAQLQKFVDLYCQFADRFKLINTQTIKREMELLPVIFRNYLSTHPEYVAARERKTRGDTFDFCSPLIVLEGMCLFERVILGKCF